MGDGTQFGLSSYSSMRRSRGAVPPRPRDTMVRVVKSKAPVVFEDLDGSLTVSGPSDGCVVHKKPNPSSGQAEGRRPGVGSDV